MHTVLASVSDSLFQVAKHAIRDLGLPGLFLMIAADATGIPIAAAATMLFAGVNVAEGHHSLWQIVVVAVAGDLVGASIAYAIGWFGRYEAVERHGRKLHMTPERLRRVEGWFERWGAPTIAVGRVIPVMRTYVSFPAGVARMPYPKFAAMTVLGGIVLALGFGGAGEALGSNYDSVRHALGYLDYAVVGVAVLLLAYWLVRRRRRATAASTAAAVDGPSS